ncbi:MAG: DUF6122 family protein [Polaribacter sp.]|nr:DUF6122 family protein [Polaribacter sp.]MDG1954358.1 DUF6122 family protein [Polaribacter sp.]
MDFKFLVHYSFHFIVPAIIAFIFFKENWKKVYLIFIAMMLIDLDHLLANPIFDPNRCSINFHPLHSYIAIGFYFLLSIWKRTRVFGIGLLLHILADTIDCFL